MPTTLGTTWAQFKKTAKQELVGWGRKHHTDPKLVIFQMRSLVAILEKDPGQPSAWGQKIHSALSEVQDALDAVEE